VLRHAIRTTYGHVLKEAVPQPDIDATKLAITRELQAAAANPEALKSVLTKLYGDAALQGAHEAAHAAGGVVVSSLQSVTAELPDDYWDKWQPGWGEAAAQDADGGLRTLLDNAEITIKGLNDSAIDRMGNVIATGLANGDSVGATAKAAQVIVADPARASMIADTEYARAMTVTSLETYVSNNVAQLEWLAEGDACADCQDNADASPIAASDDWPNGDVPVHPNCRCAIAPYFEDDTTTEVDDGS
jgi:SPP1 gp7 family putative phage head morphogenesis protein